MVSLEGQNKETRRHYYPAQKRIVGQNSLVQHSDRDKVGKEYGASCCDSSVRSRKVKEKEGEEMNTKFAKIAGTILLVAGGVLLFIGGVSSSAAIAVLGAVFDLALLIAGLFGTAIVTKAKKVVEAVKS